jgi:hypothetical protein
MDNLAEILLNSLPPDQREATVKSIQRAAQEEIRAMRDKGTPKIPEQPTTAIDSAETDPDA